MALRRAGRHLGAPGYASILRSATSLAAIALVAPALAWADECVSLDSLAWLAGEWVAERDQSAFHESWVRVSPATFEGAGVERAKKNGKPGSGEALRLVQMRDGVYYIAMAGRNERPVAFRLSECAGGRFVFVNPAHDFPRRLEYLQGGEGRFTVHVGAGEEGAFTLEFVRAPESAAPADAVLAAEDARYAAMITAVPAGIRRWLAADLEYVHSTGEVENRDQFIDSIASGNKRYLAIEPGERHVTFLDETAAVVKGLARLKVAAGATPLEFDVRYLAVYVLVEGVWQLHAWQTLRMNAEAPSP